MARTTLTLAVILAPLVAAAEGCPPVPDPGPNYARLLEEVARAPDPVLARALNGELWKIWTTAPDETAQDLLDTGMARRGEGDMAGALEALDRLVAYCPHYAEGWNQRAFVHFLRQDYPAALDDLDTALALLPTHIGALSGKALTLIGLRRDDEAQDVLREALARNPWLPERRFLVEPPGKEL